VPGEPEHYSFSHALIRTTLYEELSSARRARLHRRVGEALEELTGTTPGARIDELAHHWLAAAQVADAAKAIGYARQAGDRALGGLAYEAAAAHYEQALAVLDPTDRDGELLRCDLLLALGDAQRSAGDPRFRETMASAAALARRHGDAHRLGLAALGSAAPGGGVWRTKVDDTLVALYVEATAALGPSDSILRARLLGQLAVELTITAERERRHAISAEAVEIARRVGDRVGLAHVLIAVLTAIFDPSTLAERLCLSAELEALADDLGNLDFSQRAAHRRTGALLESGDRVGAIGAIARYEQLAVQLRVPLFNYVARLARTMWSLMCGSPDAKQQALSAFELGTSLGLPLAGDLLAIQLFEIRYRQGRLAETADAVRALTESRPNNPAVRAALALLYCEGDLLTEAREQFEHAVAMNDRLGARPAAMRTRRAYAAMLLDRDAPGDPQRAAELITAALAETEQLDVPAEAAKLQRLRARIE